MTLLAHVDDKTKYLDSAGKPISSEVPRRRHRLGHLVQRLGRATASKVRKGEMTSAELHRYYLNYPEIK